MDHWLTQAGAEFFGTAAGSTGIASSGILLFVLLGLYAGLLLNADRLPGWMRLPMPAGLRPRLTIALVLVATLPAVSLALVLSDRASRQRTDRAAASLRTEAEGVARSLDYLLEKTESGVSALAEHIERAGARTPEDLVRQLVRHHQTAAGVESMAVVRPDGTIIAATIRAGGQAVPFSGTPSQLGESELAGVALGGGGVQASGAAVEPLRGEQAAVLISAPLRAPDSTPWGAVVGAFDPASVSALVGWVRDDLPGGLVVTDGGMRVVLATAGSGLAPGQDLRGSALVSHSGAAGEPFVFALEPRAGVTEQFIGVTATLRNGWRAMRYVPLTSVQAARMQEFGVAMGWLLAALIISVCLAVALAGSISGPLSTLDAAVRQFDPERDREPARPPAGAPREVTVVFEHLATVGEHLRISYGQLRESVLRGERLRAELIHVIESREQDIESRTEQLKEANTALERLSRVDALTGVANRRWFTEFLDKAWRAALRDQQPVSIVMIDIDCFKAYNDAYGHQQGDTCIKAVAEAVRHVVGRATDMVARYGGEEFVAVLGNTPLEGALQVGEQIRAAVQGLGIPHRTAPALSVVTVSVGVTSTLPTRGSKPETSLVAADRALYAAKERGRNQVGYSSASRTGVFQSLCLPNEPGRRPS